MPSQVIFDVNQAGYQSWWFPAFGVIFFVIGAVLATINGFQKKRGIPAIRNNVGQPAFYLPWFFIGFALLWSALTFASTYGDYRHLRDAFNQGRCQVIEGHIQHFHAGSGERGDADDSFDISGSKFSYSDSTIGAGFSQTQAHGGPLKEGLCVRIYASQGDIARLEILP